MQLPEISLTRISYIVLSIFSGICFVLTFMITNSDIKNIFINLGTDALFFLFVIFVIDKLIEKHENQRWSEFDRLVKNKFRIITSIYIEGFSTFLDTVIIVEREPSEIRDNDKIFEEGLKAINTQIIPKLSGECTFLTSPEIDAILKILEDLDNAINDVYIFLLSKRNRKFIEKLLKIQQSIYSARSILEKYDTPELIEAMSILGFNKDEQLSNRLKEIGIIFLEFESN